MIISSLGAGLSGLSLAYKIRQISALKDKSILLVDKDKKDKNDRTWSFWSHKPHIFDSILYKEWSQILFANHQFEKTYDIAPYSYKMIRGIDFYEHTLGYLNEAPITDFVFGDITEISETEDETTLTCNGISYTAPTLFKSFTDKIDFLNPILCGNTSKDGSSKQKNRHSILILRPSWISEWTKMVRQDSSMSFPKMSILLS